MSESTLSPAQPRATTRTRKKPVTVPTLHLLMICIACGGVVLGGLGYLFAPTIKADFFARLAEWSMVFLFGKFTNGFGQKNLTGSDDNNDKP